MKFTKLFWISFSVLAVGCSQGNTTSGSFAGNAALTNGPVLPIIAGNNVLPLTVNGSQCSAANSVGYNNKPCVSITICSTNNSNCQTITDVLVDTGSYGLRVFKSVLNANLNLAPMMSGSKTVGDCQRYGIGSKGTADWGQVVMANVVLGGEPAVQVPIELISSNFGQPSVCEKDGVPGDSFTLDTSPSDAGYNAILGVGLFAADCGPDCADGSNLIHYFTCSGSSCTGLSVPEVSQVTNPVALLPQDNNGVLIRLPSIALGGIPSLNGYLILGIGTQANNSTAGVGNYSATDTDEFGEFTTNFAGHKDIGFIDSGSNSYEMDSTSSLPDCGGQYSGFFCPATTVNLSATDVSGSGSNTVNVPFSVGNVMNFSSSNNVFIEQAVDDGGGVFDWGLPFFIGRNVYVGLEGKSSSLGTGPYWGF